MSEQEQTPIFKVPVVPLCVDADLLALPPDTWVHIRNVSCADMGSVSSKAADAIADIQRTMARQAKGNFTMPEVADVLAAANSFDAYRFLTNEMHPAARAGALTLTNPEFGGPLVGRDCMEFHDWVTPANLDAWLERAGFPFRWPLNPEPQAAAPAPVVADSASDAPACDLSILATREQLIEAFGRFTGMDASWFKNTTDTPALLAARKVTGQGGRGHIAEPWFCPFEVMQWLADSKRRKGRKLSTEKAWELLEKNFPKVHSAHSVADPRASD
ncbi:MAG: hypothetical protein KKG12_11875 [Gammaproteobacteria bacterium]|nr:hypothetical protein [Gammaproteobacteria bacterium]